MADKIITELQLADAFTQDLSFPVDDGIQTYRATGAQVRRFIRFGAPVIVSSTTTLDSEDKSIGVNAAGGDVLINLPAVGTAEAGQEYLIMKVDSTPNLVTIDGDSSDLIFDLATLTLSKEGEFVILVNTGSEWLIVDECTRDTRYSETTVKNVTASDPNDYAWLDLSGNDITLPPGIWELTGGADSFGAGVNGHNIAWGTSNGDDTTSGASPAPTFNLSSGNTLLARNSALRNGNPQRGSFGNATDVTYIEAPRLILRIEVEQAIFLNLATEVASGTTDVQVNLFARKVNLR